MGAAGGCEQGDTAPSEAWRPESMGRGRGGDSGRAWVAAVAMSSPAGLPEPGQEAGREAAGGPEDTAPRTSTVGASARGDGVPRASPAACGGGGCMPEVGPDVERLRLLEAS